MKTMKKILCAMLISLMTLFVVPAIMPMSETVYTVEAASIKLNKTKYTMNKGEKYTLKIKGTKKKAKWSTSNKKVATVDSKGKVTAKKKGTATITAKIGSKKYKCKITVEEPKLNSTKVTLEKENTYTLKVKGTKNKISWSSNNKNVATVNSKGKVTAKKVGTATITAKVGNKKLKCTVTVKEQNFAKSISTSYTKLPDNDVLVTITNKSSKKIDYIALDVKFYKNGALIGSRMTNTVCLQGGKSAYNTVSAPYDSNYKALEFDSVKISITSAERYEYVPYTGLYKYLKVNCNLSADRYYGVIGEVTNIGSEKIGSAKVGVIYYKNNQIVGYDQEYIYDLDEGASKTVNFSKPTDNNYNYLEFDSYKVVTSYVYAD